MPPRDKDSHLDDIAARDALPDLNHLDSTFLVPAEPDWDSPHNPSDLLRLEVATYIGHMSAELGRMASRSELGLLSYFLDMAAAEARESANRLGLELHAARSANSLEQDQTLT
ncbi:MAG: hypothetical protein NTZ14_15345 [Hyphomicrobiales bacterium]|nr:hypothetical protein [Hyphomicrobiales bacterium]